MLCSCCVSGYSTVSRGDMLVSSVSWSRSRCLLFLLSVMCHVCVCSAISELLNLEWWAGLVEQDTDALRLQFICRLHTPLSQIIRPEVFWAASYMFKICWFNTITDFLTCTVNHCLRRPWMVCHDEQGVTWVCLWLSSRVVPIVLHHVNSLGWYPWVILQGQKSRIWPLWCFG
jgi:hypothetical protein